VVMTEHQHHSAESPTEDSSCGSTHSEVPRSRQATAARISGSFQSIALSGTGFE